MFGSSMTANGFSRIITNQKKFMVSLLAGQLHDMKYGKQAKTRLMHYHYITFPVELRSMSSHPRRRAYRSRFHEFRLALALAAVVLSKGDVLRPAHHMAHAISGIPTEV